MTAPFSFASTPRVYFGAGKISTLPAAVKTYGRNALLITGAHSFNSHYGPGLIHQLTRDDINIQRYTIETEPTPLMIDRAIIEFSSYDVNVVIAIGGGSVLDAGKAIAAMLPLKESVKDYLEGIGTKIHPGIKVPFIAVPTTSGTGSEATKNAVLSETGERGYKKSLRHDNFVANVAIIDPFLTVSCSPNTTAASGMDTLTQLLESYLSTAANPITDALAYKGLYLVSRSLLAAYHDGSSLGARSDMALAAYLSGVTLANAGLGLVHGFASSIGGYFEIPHGVICSTIMGAANRVTVRKLRHEKKSELALLKYATIGKLFTNEVNKSDDYFTDILLNTIDSWTTLMKIPRLSQLGVAVPDFQKIIDATDNKTNPVHLSKGEMTEVLEMAL
ncbi:MAG TPA: iron-containing alcohol dehydrogenase [Cyclobacteriaceae bacterium]|nr:iron-containing alcohol dehydrogenase [Cyclobacteriaceae bacterium]